MLLHPLGGCATLGCGPASPARADPLGFLFGTVCSPPEEKTNGKLIGVEVVPQVREEGDEHLDLVYEIVQLNLRPALGKFQQVWVFAFSSHRLILRQPRTDCALSHHMQWRTPQDERYCRTWGVDRKEELR